MWEVVSDYVALEEEGACCTCKDRLVSYKGEKKNYGKKHQFKHRMTAN